MEPGTLRLFVFTYQDGQGETKQFPIYSIAYEPATHSALDWLIEHIDCTWLSIQYAPEEGVTLDGTFYSATKEEGDNTEQGLLLYVMEYFQVENKYVGLTPARNVIQLPIYTDNIEQAIVVMNERYKRNGMGHLHKSLERNSKGITLNGTYYPPTK